MTIILISTKTLIKKKKERELRREDCVQTLWNIFGTFQVYLEVIISCAKKMLQFQVENEWLVYYNTCPNFNPNKTVSSNLKKARNNKLL